MASDEKGSAQASGPRPFRAGAALKGMVDREVTITIQRRVKVGKTNHKRDVGVVHLGNLAGTHDVVDGETGEVDFTIIHFLGMPPVTIDWGEKRLVAFVEVS